MIQQPSNERIRQALGWVSCALLLFLAAWPSAAQKKAEPHPAMTRMIIPEGAKCFDWIMDEASGRIFTSVVIGASGSVIEFDLATGKEQRRFKVTSQPVHLAIKNSTLIVGDRGVGKVHFIDLKSNKLSGELQLPVPWVNSIFCSEADNSYIYVAAGKSYRERIPTIYQIDLGTRKVRKQHDGERWRGSRGLGEVVMSPDGRFILAGAPQKNSGNMLMRVDEEACTFDSLVEFREDKNFKQAGPSNRFWTIQRHPLISFESSPYIVALHSTRDLAAGITMKKVGHPAAQFSQRVYRSCHLP